MKILAITSETSACDYHRVTLPMKFLPKDASDEYRFSFGSEKTQLSVERDLKGTDILFFNRIPSHSFAHLTKAREFLNFKIVVDIDDFWELYPRHHQYESWQKNNMTDRLKNAIFKADLVTCTNDRLSYEIYKLGKKRVKVLPNALPFGKQQFIEDPTEKNEGKIKFIVAGGNSHFWDLKSIEGLWLRSFSDSVIKENASYILAGYTDSGIWRAMHNLMDNSRITSTRAVKPLDRYMDSYNGTHVVLAPLENNKFNTFKSNLKILEAGAKKMPIICSRMYPYLEDEQMDGKGLILCKDSGEFMEAIKYFIRNPEQIAIYGQTLHNYVKEKYDLADVNARRYKIFKSLL